MATTSPDNLPSPDAGDEYALIDDLDTFAAATQAALARRCNQFKGTTAQRNAFTTAPDGVLWRDISAPYREYIRRGGAWVGLTPISGSVTFNPPSGGATSMKQAITFPTGYFTKTPWLFVWMSTGAGATVISNPSAANSDLSPAGATITYSRSNATESTVWWIAFPNLE